MPWMDSGGSGSSGNGFGEDSILNIDTPDLGSEDCEFSAETSSLPSGWSWYNQGTTTYEESDGTGRLLVPAANLQLRGIVRAVPAGGSWTAKLKLLASPRSNAGADIQSFGLCLRQSSNGKQYMVRIGSQSGLVVTNCANDQFGSATNTSTARASNDNGGVFRIIKNSATSYDFAFSTTGGAFVTLQSAVDVSAHMTPDQIGVVIYNDCGYPMAYDIDWYRKV